MIQRASERALAVAQEALVAHATGRPIDEAVGPGYLPCPDLDDDGWAESTCGSQDGHTGQAQRLGRLPWKTLGIPDLRDGDSLATRTVSAQRGSILDGAGAPIVAPRPVVRVADLELSYGRPALQGGASLRVDF